MIQAQQSKRDSQVVHKAQTTIATHGGAQRRPIRMQRRCLLGLLAVLALSLPLLLATAARSQQVVHSTPAPSELELPNGEPLPTPSEQVRVICSLPDFQARPNLNATVVVFAWRRLESLRRLTRSLERAEYCGTEVPLLVLADAGASAEVLAYVTALQWSHGAKRLYVHEGTALGIRGMWIHMFRQAEGRNLLPFEDDIEVSPLYSNPNPNLNLTRTRTRYRRSTTGGSCEWSGSTDPWIRPSRCNTPHAPRPSPHPHISPHALRPHAPPSRPTVTPRAALDLRP